MTDAIAFAHLAEESTSTTQDDCCWSFADKFGHSLKKCFESCQKKIKDFPEKERTQALSYFTSVPCLEEVLSFHRNDPVVGATNQLYGRKWMSSLLTSHKKGKLNNLKERPYLPSRLVIVNQLNVFIVTDRTMEVIWDGIGESPKEHCESIISLYGLDISQWTFQTRKLTCDAWHYLLIAVYAFKNKIYLNIKKELLEDFKQFHFCKSWMSTHDKWYSTLTFNKIIGSDIHEELVEGKLPDLVPV